MKVALLVLAGVAAGMLFYRIPHYVDEYSMHGTPPPWTGPRYRHWKNGVEVTERVDPSRTQPTSH